MNYNLLNILETETNFCDCLIRIFIFLGHIMNFIKILVPIIIILMGSIDLIKAVIAQKDDEMKKAQSIFIKRLIYGVVLFFVIAAVQFLIGLAGGDTNNRCFKCVADVNGSGCDKDNIPVCRDETTINNENPNTENNTPNEEPETVPETETPDYVEIGTEGCRVHFTSNFITDEPIAKARNSDTDTVSLYSPYIPIFRKMYRPRGDNNSTNVYYEWGDDYNVAVGSGKYSSIKEIMPNAETPSLTSLAIDKNTKLIIYEKENFEGNIIFEKEGPLLVWDKFWENAFHTDYTFSAEFEGYNAIFTKDKRIWANIKKLGSYEVICY